MVKGGSEVVNQVAHHHVQKQGRLQADFDAQAIAAALRVDVLPDSVGIGVVEGRDLILEGVQMFFGSVELGPDACEGIAHAA